MKLLLALAAFAIIIALSTYALWGQPDKDAPSGQSGPGTRPTDPHDRTPK